MHFYSFIWLVSKTDVWYPIFYSGDCRIHKLDLCRGVRLLQRVSLNDTKQSDCEALWNNTQTAVGVVSLGVRLLVWTTLLTLTPGRVGISQVVQKTKIKQQTKGGRKKQTNMDFELQTLESEVGTFSTPQCIYVWPSRELSENPTQLPNMLTHLFIIFTALSWFHAPEFCCGADNYVDPANELCEWGTAKAIGRNKGEVTIITSDNLFCHIYKRECKCPWWLLLVVEYS